MSIRFLLAPMMMTLFATWSCVTPTDTTLIDGVDRWSVRCEVIATIKDESFLAHPISCEIKNLATDTALQLAMGEAPSPKGFTFIGQERMDELFRTRASIARSVLSAGAVPMMAGTNSSDGRGQLILLGSTILMHALNQTEQSFTAEKKDYIDIAPGQKQMLNLVLERNDKNNLAVKPPPTLSLCFVKPASTCSEIKLIDPFANRRRSFVTEEAYAQSNELSADKEDSSPTMTLRDRLAADKEYVAGRRRMITGGILAASGLGAASLGLFFPEAPGHKASNTEINIRTGLVLGGLVTSLSGGIMTISGASMKRAAKARLRGANLQLWNVQPTVGISAEFRPIFGLAFQFGQW